jgi:hypothetical protein
METRLKILHTTTLLLALGALATPAHAAPADLHFDDIALLPGQYQAIGDGYADLDWDNFYIINTSGGGVKDSGYGHGTASGSNAAFNGGGKNAGFSRGSAFNLLSVNLAKAWKANVVHFDGYVGDTLSYQLDVALTTTATAAVEVNWAGVNKVVFNSGDSQYQQLVLDDLRIDLAAPPLPVAEPEGYAMLLAGIGLLGLLARRRAPAP